MKNLRNKVILSGIVLLFAFIATIGSTYAWFTVSSTATVSEITLNVQAEENLLIKIVPYNEGSGTFAPDYSLNPAGYQSAVTLAQLQTAGYLPTGTPWRLLPSTVFATDEATHDDINERVLHYLGDPTDSLRTLVAAPFNNGSSGRYVQLQFIVMQQSDIPQALEMRTIRISASYGVGDARNNIAEAVRLSVWGDDTGYLGHDTEYTPLIGAPLTFGRDSDFAYSFAGRTGFTFTNLDTIAQIRDGISPLYPTVIDIYDGSSWVDPVQDVFILQPNAPTLITVNIYIEGWDEQADNYIIGAEFDISFAFTIGSID